MYYHGISFVAILMVGLGDAFFRSHFTPAKLPHYKLRFGDCPGYDIKKLDNASITTCQQTCDELSECQAFVFVPSRLYYMRYDNFRPYCWLKHKTCKILSSYQRAWYYDKFVTLGNYTKLMRDCSAPTVASISNVTLDVCKEACDDMAECKAFVYNNDMGNKAVVDGGTRCDFKTEYCANVSRVFDHKFLYTKITPPVTRQVPNVDCVIKTSDSSWGAHYMGTQNVANGVHCMRWDRLSLARRTRPSNERGYLQNRLPDLSLEDAANYCRMPRKQRNGPYCYINADFIPEKVFCNIPECIFDNSTSDIYSIWTDEINVDCLSGSVGADYIGTVNVTISGKTCKSWSLVKNVTARNFPDDSVEAAASYCRNPFLHRDGPWCYINEDGSEWERCKIKMCPQLTNETACIHTTLGEDYKGRRFNTASGKRCVPWGIVKDSIAPQNSYTCKNPDLSPDGPWCYTGGNRTCTGYGNSYRVVGAARESCGLDYCEGFIPQWLLNKIPMDEPGNEGGKSAMDSQKEGSSRTNQLWLVVPVASFVVIVSIAFLLAYLTKTNKLRNPFKTRMQHKRFENEADMGYDVTMSGLEEQPF